MRATEPTWYKWFEFNFVSDFNLIVRVPMVANLDYHLDWAQRWLGGQ